ncbi:MAG: TRAP transporter substrate-binding protein [Desulfosarcinaceae bacterium]|nr:TRAP transporter substrate-binding protein [Desulfosarcinaceae bacterium]
MNRNRNAAWIIFSVSLIAFLSFAGTVFAETTQLTYSIFFPATHGQAEAGMAWAKEVEKRSQGQVKITVFPGGTLTKANQCYDGVVNGISDIGMSVFAYNRGRFPVMEAVDLPLGYPNGKVATKVVNDFFQQVQPKELSDVKVLYLHAHGPGLLHTKKPVRALADMDKLKIRSTGLSAKVVEALGAIPVAMPQGATYESLQKGVVEGTFGPIEVLKGWRQAEVVKYTTDCRGVGYTTAMFVVMNLKKWNALDDPLKQVFESVSAEWIDVHGAKWDEVDAAGRAFTQELGNSIIDLDPAESDRWKAAVAPILDDYVTRTKSTGIDGKPLVDNLKAMIQKYAAE